MPRGTPEQRRRNRMAFDATDWERRHLNEAARVAGLSFTAWARSSLLIAARNLFADSIQHPRLYPQEIAAPPPAPEPAPIPQPRPPAEPKLVGIDRAALAPEIARQRPPARRWEPYGPPLASDDTDGLNDPNEAEVPGLGRVKF